MKKVGKYLIFSLIVFLVGMGNVFARDYDLQTVGDLVLQENPNAESFYVVGKYIFTMSYVKENNLNTEDFMLAARSINVSEDEGKVKGTSAYEKMSVYQILSHTDNYGDVTDWYVGKNLIGEGKISENTKFEIEYIDYQDLGNVYFVTFQDEKGNELTKRAVIEGKKTSTPSVESRENYQFLGWYKEDDTLFDEDKEPITKDITVKQKWEAKKVTIKFNEEVEGTEKEKTYTYPDIIPSDLASIKPKAKIGYNFNYWYNSMLDDTIPFDFSQKLELSKDNLSQTITLNAKWEKAAKVTFKAEVDNKANDEFVKDKETQYANMQNHLTEEQIPQKEHEGYEFKGWFLQDGTAINPTNYEFKNAETIVVGKWETKIYTVTFDTDGGTEIGTVKVKHGDLLTNPGNASKTSTDSYNGYEFVNWYKCNGENCDTEFDFDKEKITSDITLKAKYQSVVYTNKMIHDFASEITNNNISAFVEKDKNLTIAILEKDKLLAENLEHVINALKKFASVKNVDIKINSSETLTPQNADGELKKVFTELLPSTDLTNAKLENLYEKSFTITFKLASGVKNEEGTDSNEYQANFTTNFVFVANESELESALSGDKEIIIKNWEGTISKSLDITKDIVIDGKNTEIESTIKTSGPVFKIKSGSVVIKDLKLKIDVLKPSEYNKENQEKLQEKNTIGIEVEKGATLTANNFHVTNKEKINETSLEIDKEKLLASTVTINENAAILLKGTLYASNISYEDEIYGSPTVLATKEATMNVLGGNKQEYIYNIKRKEDGTSEEADLIKDYIHYYKDYKHSRLIFVNYVSMNNSYTSISYINNEQYFIPNSFEKNGLNFNYTNEVTEKKYIFNNKWNYTENFEEKTINTKELQKKKATLNSENINYYAQYNEIKAPVIKDFHLGDKNEESTTASSLNYHLTFEGENVTHYCVTTETNKNNCEWKEVNDKKEITGKVNFDNYGSYTYYAYVKNSDDVVSNASQDSISYIKEDFKGKAEDLKKYNPKGLDNTVKDGMYRYFGKDVENYICFGTSNVDECLKNPDKYRYQIIGITEGGKFKLIKSSPYGWYQWHSKYTVYSCGFYAEKCRYPDSDIYTVLNKNYASTLADWTKKVDYATWYIGSVKSEDRTSHTVFEKEKKESTTNGKFGLMNTSDYYYAYNADANTNCRVNNCESYLSTPYNDWTLNRRDYDSTIYSNYIYYINSASNTLRMTTSEDYYSVRPVFYLLKDTTIQSGIGSRTRPFIIK